MTNIAIYETEEQMDHIPVLLNEVLRYLKPEDGKVYLDCTFGAGGYSRAILEQANCHVIAIDQDPDVQKYAEQLRQDFPGRFTFMAGNFSQANELLLMNGVTQLDGIVMDLGVSSMQLDQAKRGFSFLYNADLDMRMSQHGVDAKDFINEVEEGELANIIYKYGEERDSRRIARAIIEQRAIEPITTTNQLAKIVRSAIGARKSKIDLATKTFQAIRIYVNKELEALEEILKNSEFLLNKEGKLVTVSFHSLEDKIVKEFLKEKSGNTQSVSRYAPLVEDDKNKIFKILTRKAVKPSATETAYNPRARSAKLRAAERL